MIEKWNRTYDYWDKLRSMPNATLCPRWKFSFKEFLQDLGFMQHERSILRMYKDEKIFNKNNCKWSYPVNYDIYKAIQTFCDPNYVPEKYQLPHDHFVDKN